MEFQMLGYPKVLLRQCLGELQRPVGANEDKSGARTSAPLDPQTVSEAKRQLAAILGPIAEILVDKAAGRAASAADLFGQLALNINDERDRERFLANGAAGFARPSASGISKTAARTNAIAPSEIASLAAALTPYLGPIAPIVAERESRACTNTEELRRRLAALISAERDRSAFLKRATVSD